MANQRISHIRAKLKDQSVGQVFDIYDETAYHSPDYVLDVTEANPTAGSGITVSSVSNNRSLGLCILSFNITTAETLTSSIAVFTGAFSADKLTSAVMVNINDNTTYPFNIRTSGEIHFGKNTPAGTYIGQVVYKYKNS